MHRPGLPLRGEEVRYERKAEACYTPAAILRGAMKEHSLDNNQVSRREAMKTALKTGAYAAPVILMATVPQVVGAVSPPLATVDLAVAKSVTPVSGAVPTTTAFTVTVTNNGPGAASAITVTDALNATAFQYQSSTASQGAYNPITGAWTVPQLAVGATATLTINVLALLEGPQTNTATLTSSTPSDRNAANNTASATFTGIIALGVG